MNIDEGLWRKIGMIAVIPILGFSIYIGLSPILKLKEISEYTAKDKTFMEKFDTAFRSRELTPFIREKAFKEALTDISGKDSISLFLDLHDSIAGLSVSGVVIDSVGISRIKTDKMLSELPNILYAKLFSDPISIKSEFATIEKEPVIIKKAPKDSIEALNNLHQPDSLINGHVFAKMFLDHNLLIILEQGDNQSFSSFITRLFFRAKISAGELFKNISGCLMFKKPEYVNKIIIRLPASDICEIYRAIPIKGKVVIRLP